ncbi:transcription factor SPEECHLESS [Cucumis melo var. makuwa]|nr:transcription factor SPEECHLESS [Cucumis melo]KAA0050458.1 transcription factor SPEECHLESS [Cucumis melo var. makuwa]TYK03138.1 transcription factor SPEECHLESS [Cucumis melo var. makuwa]
MVDTFADLFQQNDEFVDHTLNPHFEGDDLFSIFESLENVAEFTMIEDDTEPVKDGEETTSLVFSETELETSPKTKRLKTIAATSPTAAMTSTGLSSSEDPNPDGPQRMSHITVERNRRKQMNEHLTVLRSLMPCFYVKKGDQASIIGGVVEYIKELQQVLQSLEAKKQRKVVYSEVLSPRVVSSPRPNLAMSPRKPPLSPRLNLPISPRTPQPTSPYSKPPPRLQQTPSAATGGGAYNNISSSSSSTTNMANNNNSLEPSPCNSCSTTNSSIDNNNNNNSNSNSNNNNDLVANSKSAIAEVEVKFTGPNVVLKTVSPPIPGQAFKIISALEQLSLEILHVKITTLDETMFNSFTIKIGIECQLSAEELAQQIQQTFC